MTSRRRRISRDEWLPGYDSRKLLRAYKLAAVAAGGCGPDPVAGERHRSSGESLAAGANRVAAAGAATLHVVAVGRGAGQADDNATRAGKVTARGRSAERKLGREISGRAAGGPRRCLWDQSATGRSPVPSEVQGFFIVSAASLEEAAAVARSSPHVP